MQESGLIEIIPLMGILSRASILLLPILNPLRVHSLVEVGWGVGGTTVADGHMMAISFVYLYDR